MEALRLSHEQYPLRVEKIRHIGQEPFSHVVNFVPPWTIKNIRPQDVQEVPTLQILEKDHLVQIANGLQSISTVISGTKLATFLKVRLGTPLMRIERTVYDIKDRPVEYVVTHYRGDRYSYSVSLQRLAADTEGNGKWLVSST
jgi:GntR family transcriptional regulator